MPLPYGSWPSPLTASSIASDSPRIEGARFVGDEVWWGESVPAEGGRIAVRRSGDPETPVLPDPWNARSRVHEYGGGSWTTDPSTELRGTAAGTLYFVENTDQRVYRLSPGGQPQPLTAEGPRHGGLTFQHGRLLAVRETHDGDGITRSIVEVPTDGSAASDLGAVRTLADSSTFLAHPALSPDGAHLAWVAWDHPHMPWEKAALRIARTDGTGEVVEIATTAALQPEWTGTGELLFADDPSGRWNLFRLRLGEGNPIPVAPADADTGGGLWVLGNRWYRPLEDGRIVAVRTNGTDELVVIEPDGTERTLDLPLSAGLSIDDARGSRVLVSGAGATRPAGLWLIDIDGDAQLLRGGVAAASGWTPAVRQITVDGPHGPVHAFDYPPTHPEAAAPDDELPPYLVLVHGGPTAHVSGQASAAITYFTSRGIGVLDVNYGGSSGYGRAYRERLAGQWGIVDVDDVLAAAAGLADAGLADPARLAIRGGSAGGWTVLSCLVRGGVFGAGISRYGVSDLRALAADTHDFEKHYLDGLVGPLPETESVYIQRSPLTHADRIDVPVLLLQGAEDAVVPPSQSESIRDALAARGVPHEYVLFEGEGHGFRRAETIVQALETELAFLGRVFGFEPRF